MALHVTDTTVGAGPCCDDAPGGRSSGANLPGEASQVWNSVREAHPSGIFGRLFKG